MAVTGVSGLRPTLLSFIAQVQSLPAIGQIKRQVKVEVREES
jgi:hypothetical protein